MLAKISEFLRGGTSGFNEAEKLLLASLEEALPAQDRNILSRQLKAVRKVQRQNPGRLVVAYYKNRDDVPPLSYAGYEYCLAKITYRSGGRNKTTSLVLHDGRFMSFERNVPQGLADIDSISAVTLHPGGFKGVAEEIDSEEH